MKKKLSFLVLVLMTLVLVVALSGCRASDDLSGKYVTGTGTEYIEFTGNKKVILSSEGKNLFGKYELDGKVLTITFDVGSYSTDEILTVNEKRNIIYYGNIAFVKESKGLPWWGWLLIISVGYTIISAIFKAVTGKDLDDYTG